MAAGVHSINADLNAVWVGDRMTGMRFSLAVAVIVVGAGVSGLAQKNTYDAKPSDPLHVKQSSLLPAGKAGVGSSSAANARDLDAVQRQAAANSRASSAKASKVSSSTSKLTPIKEKSNPPIKFGAAGGAKSSGLTSQGADPYKGRVKQHKHQ
jgi:hypothetical protein